MSTLEINSIISNRYQVLSILGKGGMATAYRVFDKERQTEVALKALNADQLRLARRKDRFLNEFSILSGLHHPNIVEVYEQAETESGAPFFTMECLNGKALSDGLKEASAANSDLLSVGEAIVLLEEVAKALSYLHEQGIIYCDLKPANLVLLAAPGINQSHGPKVKLIDFGISRSLNEKPAAEESKMVGTSYYMSPEQIRSEELDARSDIYSFGVLAFELLTGSVPFNHEALFTVTASHLIGKVPSIRELKREMPKSLDRMIQICMEKSKEQRYGSMNDILGRLEGASQQLGKPSWVKRLLGRA